VCCVAEAPLTHPTLRPAAPPAASPQHGPLLEHLRPRLAPRCRAQPAGPPPMLPAARLHSRSAAPAQGAQPRPGARCVRRVASSTARGVVRDVACCAACDSTVAADSAACGTDGHAADGHNPHDTTVLRRLHEIRGPAVAGPNPPDVKVRQRLQNMCGLLTPLACQHRWPRWLITTRTMP